MVSYRGSVKVTGFAVLALIAFLTMRGADANLEADADASA